MNSALWLDFSPLDVTAMAWFLACWVGYTLAADSSRLRRRSMTAAMHEHRKGWMVAMLKRENRIVDIQIIGNQLNGAAFFASTTILAVGGLFALLGATDKAMAILADLPVALSTSRLAWEVKILLLVMTFIYAFFKFAWAFRLYNYCSVLIGSVPIEADNDPKAPEVATRAAAVNRLAARHFNQGLRAYFFILAALSWFVHPFLFMATTAWVVWVLYRREFRSRSLRAVKDPIADRQAVGKQNERIS